MNKLYKLLSPKSEDPIYFNKLKTRFFITICVFGSILLMGFIISDVVIWNDNFVVSFTSKLATLLFLIVCFILLKHKGIALAGNFFSIGSLLVLLVFVNILPEGISPISKYIQGFYSVYIYLIMAMLFASRTVIILNAFLIVISTTHIYIRARLLLPDEISLYTSAYVNHTFITFAITLVAYNINKFTEQTIEKANHELKLSELQNQELLASEEEIRAANEELIATTDALVESNKELEQAKNKAIESDRLKTEFLNNMSHEVRTPMNGIIGFSQLLEAPNLDSKTLKYYTGIIQNSSNQLLMIIDNIIEISKLGTKQVKVNSNAFFLNEKLRELKDVFAIEATNKKLDLNLITPLRDEDSIIRIDEIKLYKILSNLIENAIKFTSKGQIDLGYKILDITENNEKPMLQLYVKDTGIGIAEEHQKMIFEKFRQADAALSRQYGGLGLGLSIAMENAQLLGGKIELKSTPGEGSVFYVIVPYQTADNHKLL